MLKEKLVENIIKEFMTKKKKLNNVQYSVKSITECLRFFPWTIWVGKSVNREETSNFLNSWRREACLDFLGFQTQT